MDVLNEWLKNRAVNSNTFVEIVVCRDGYSFSCEANKWAHCNPRELGAYPYSSVELGFPSDQDELIDIYAEDKDPGFDCVTGDVDAVYPYVPVQTVIKLIKKHGGFKDGPSKADIDILEAGYKLIEPSVDNHLTYFKHVNDHKIRVIDINTGMLKEIINDAHRKDDSDKIIVASARTKARLKSVLNLMFDYALEYEIVNRNPARAFELSKDLIKTIEKEKVDHITFSDEEMDILWNHRYDGYVDVILIQCYGGWRPQELGLIELKNVDLENNIIVGGMKTEAGTDRNVPIHPKIKDLIVRRYNEAQTAGSEYLINTIEGCTKQGRWKLTYDKYNHRFKKIIEKYNLNPMHKAHDGRKHFVTAAKKYKVDEYAVKYIIGHKISDLTERVYTDRDIEWLKKEISKIV